MSSSSLGSQARSFTAFLKFVVRRFAGDDAPGLAAGLSYTSLLALVPLVVIALAIFAAFPAFESVRGALQELILESLLPTQKDEVQQRLTGFIENARSMTGPGVVFLGLTAVMLLMRIHTSLDIIWRVTAKRAMVYRLLLYWALLTVGPVLLGASLSISGYIFAVVEASGADAFGVGAGEVGRLVAVLLNVAAFTFLFVLLPNRSIRWRHGITGAFVAAGLFEVLKELFALYVTAFPSYEVIYGALASVPIFLLWMYLVWMVVLLGAEVAAALPEWAAQQQRKERIGAPIDRLPIALLLLHRLYRAQQRGDTLRGRVLRADIAATFPEIDEVARPLQRGGFILRTHRGRYALGRDLGSATLGDLLRLLGLDIESSQGWGEPITSLLKRLHEGSRELEALPIAKALAGVAAELDEERPAAPVGAPRVAE